jgi:hypothetical protein
VPIAMYPQIRGVAMTTQNFPALHGTTETVNLLN